MSFLTDQERSNLRIQSMTLHVVGGEDFSPEAARDVEHENFFIARILDTDVASIYRFKPVSGARELLENMAQQQQPFESGAQELSRQFARFHGTTAREGAFFIFELATDDPRTRIYSLIKYDYEEAIEQTEGQDGSSLLRRIVHAFIADKKAIQKSAMIRIVDGIADANVSAHDRIKKGAGIGDYFAAFLDVDRSRTDHELNETVVELVRQALKESKEVLPDRNVAQAFHRARDFLNDKQEINEEAIFESVIVAAGNPDQENTRNALRRRVLAKIRSAKLTGLSFPPDRQVLRRPRIRRVKTIEGVTLTYPDDPNGVTVTRQSTEGGGEVITITTNRIQEDIIVSDSAR